MKKKRVAMMLETEPSIGGSHRYALIIAECLKELSGAHYEVIALSMNDFWDRWCEDNHVKHISLKWIGYTPRHIAINLRFPFYSQIYNTYRTELGRIIKKEKLDVLFCTDQIMYIFNLNVKLIIPVHDLMHRYEPSFPEVQSDYQRRELIYKCHAKYADYILTDSKLGRKQFRDSYLDYLRKNKRKPKIVVLPFIASSHVLEAKEESIQIPDKYVFYPAQFWKHKNHMNLVKAIQILKYSIKDIHLVLVGSEKNCCEEIIKYIADNNLEENIIIMGFVSDGNMAYLYRHAVAMIMPSYFGPTNIPPLEAMALGCPVAVSNKYAMSEQVGKSGLLFNPDSPEEIADCIRRLWTDENLRKTMIESGYKKVNKWTKEEFKNKLAKVIERCIV